MCGKGPGKAFMKGLTIVDLVEMFPAEGKAREWLEGVIWPDGRVCPTCGSGRTCDASHAKMPYWCSDCRSYFSVRKGTLPEASKLSFRKWVYAIYLHMTSLEGVSSMKPHRDIGVTQKTAWFMLQRIREAFRRDDGDEPPFTGPVEADEAYFGGRERNRHASGKLNAGRGTVGKTAVVGAKDRETDQVAAKVVTDTGAKTLQGFVEDHTDPTAQVYTDGASAYVGIRRKHGSVSHSAGEYVRERAHTNGMESFRAMLKRAHKGTFHKFSPRHLQRYVSEFSGRHNVRLTDAIAQMVRTADAMRGKRLRYRDLVAGNGLPSGAGLIA